MSGSDVSAASGVYCDPKEMRFKHLEQSERQRTQLTLFNPTYHRFTFKVKTTSPKSYVVKPSVGFLEPDSKFNITIIKQRNPKPTAADKFLIELMAANEKSNNAAEAKNNANKALRMIKIPVLLDTEASSSTDSNGSAKDIVANGPSLKEEESFIPTPPQTLTKSPSRTSPAMDSDVRPTTAVRDGLKHVVNADNAGGSVISSIRLYNPTDDRYAFKVRNTFPKGFKVKPPQGFLKPRTAIDVEVILLNSRGLDFSFAKFLVQSFVVDFSDEVITEAMYHKAKLYKAVREIELDVKLIGFDESRESESSKDDQERSAAAAYEIRYLRKQLIHMESELNSLKHQIKRQEGYESERMPIRQAGSNCVDSDCVGCIQGKQIFRFRRSRKSIRDN